jgi:hypothetical protein
MNFNLPINYCIDGPNIYIDTFLLFTIHDYSHPIQRRFITFAIAAALLRNSRRTEVCLQVSIYNVK